MTETHTSAIGQDLWPTDWPQPNLSTAAFVAKNAVVLGAVELGEGSSIWYGATVRADVAPIQIGDYTNIQDGAVLHCDLGQPTVLEDHVTIGHRAVIHSAHIERGCLIGIGAIILNGVRIGTGSIVGAGAVVSKSIPPYSLWMGVPAKPFREVGAQEASGLIEHAQNYYTLALAHANRSSDLDL